MDPIIESAGVRGKIVVFKDSVDAAEVAEKSAQIATKHRITRENIYKLCVKGFNTGCLTDAQCEMLLRGNPEIESIYDDYEVTAYAQHVPWNIRRIGTCDAGCSAGIGSRGPEKDVDVFLLDTGCCASNELNVVEHRVFVRNENATDHHGHGTAVASIIAARDNDSLAVGVAPGARIHSYKVLDKTGVGLMSGVLSALEAVLEWRATRPEAGCLINISFGAFVGISESVLDRALGACEKERIPVVVAAGNDASDISLYSPARVSTVFAVGAYDKSNNVCDWSNYGSTIDFYAPGAHVLALYKNNKLATMSGTSLAAAHVSGAIALFLARAPHITPSQARIYLKQTSNMEYDGANSALACALDGKTRQSIYLREF
jgi:subtilisin family serine protease